MSKITTSVIVFLFAFISGAARAQDMGMPPQMSSQGGGPAFQNGGGEMMQGSFQEGDSGRGGMMPPQGGGQNFNGGQNFGGGMMPRDFRGNIENRMGDFPPPDERRDQGGDMNGGGLKQVFKAIERPSAVPNWEQPSSNADAQHREQKKQQFEKERQMRIEKMPRAEIERQKAEDRSYDNGGNASSRSIEKMDREIKNKENTQEGGENGDGAMFDEEQRMHEDVLRRAKDSLRGLEQGLKMITAQMTRMDKKKVVIPAEIRELVASLSRDVALVKSTTEINDEIEIALERLMDNGEALRDIGPRLGLLENWTKMDKDVTKRIARLRKAIARGKASAIRAKIDVTPMVAKIEADLEVVLSAFAEVKTVATGTEGDAEEAMSRMRDEVFEPLMDIERDVAVLRDAANLHRAIARVLRRADILKKAAAVQKKRSKDTARLDELIASVYAKAEEAKQLFANGSEGLDREGIFELVSEAEMIGNDAQEALDKLRNVKTEVERALSGEVNGAAVFFSRLLAPWSW